MTSLFWAVPLDPRGQRNAAALGIAVFAGMLCDALRHFLDAGFLLCHSMVQRPA
jgi:hypothetical protein